MPAMAVESGPAAGVIAAPLIGRQLGLPNLISFDMGGTTAKASLIERGEITTTCEYEVGGGGNARRWMHGTGHPIRVPVIDLAEVSAGGGSIAWIDPGGALRVGPESAGRRARARVLWPGRRAADRHRRRPGARLSQPGGAAGRRAAGRPRPRARRHRARDRRPLGLGVLEAAAGIVDVVNAGMARRASHRLRRARPRPARVRAGGLRRRRPGARGAAGRGAGDPAR